MRTFLRDTTTGQYFQGLNRWTPDRQDAYDFGLIARAFRFARKIRLPGLELIVDVEDPNLLGDTPFELFWRRTLHARQ